MGWWETSVNFNIRYEWKRDWKSLVIHDIGPEIGLTPVKKYTEHSIIAWGSIYIPGTDDHLKVIESRVFLCIWLKVWSDNGDKILSEILFWFYK